MENTVKIVVSVSRFIPRTTSKQNRSVNHYIAVLIKRRKTAIKIFHRENFLSRKPAKGVSSK
jgi:hypothetical protein